MKRHQQQPRSKPPQPPIPVRSSQPSRQKSEAAARLGTSAWIRPLALLGAAWIGMVVIALMALSGLLSPDSSNGTRTTGAAIARNTAATAPVSKQQSRLPLWLFGAIALSCAAGSILISKQAARPPRPRKSMKPRQMQPYPVPEAPSPLLASSLPATPLAPTTTPSFALTQRHAPMAESSPFTTPVTLMQLAQMQMAPPVSAPVVGSTAVPVTVVPPEEKAPLDWGEASLADKLDLRKQRSISSLL